LAGSSSCSGSPAGTHGLPRFRRVDGELRGSCGRPKTPRAGFDVREAWPPEWRRPAAECLRLHRDALFGPQRRSSCSASATTPLRAIPVTADYAIDVQALRGEARRRPSRRMATDLHRGQRRHREYGARPMTWRALAALRPGRADLVPRRRARSARLPALVPELRPLVAGLEDADSVRVRSAQVAVHALRGRLHPRPAIRRRTGRRSNVTPAYSRVLRPGPSRPAASRSPRRGVQLSRGFPRPQGLDVVQDNTALDAYARADSSETCARPITSPGS